MKGIIVSTLMVILFASCQDTGAGISATDTADEVKADLAVNPAAPDAPVLSFEDENYNFGKITQGEKVSYSYKFKNVGKSPLIILNATATCGCTVPEPPKEPIKPGAEGEIKVVFDSNGKSGLQDKVITVTSNAQPPIASLHLTGEVKEQSN